VDLVMPEFESVDPIGQCQDCLREFDKDELSLEGDYMLCGDCR
jgi:hypothetical protein